MLFFVQCTCMYMNIVQRGGTILPNVKRESILIDVKLVVFARHYIRSVRSLSEWGHSTNIMQFSSQGSRAARRRLNDETKR
jgi:hypothetical protein